MYRLWSDLAMRICYDGQMKTGVQRREVVLNGVPHEYRLRRSKRARHILLHVGLEGIEVVVPWHAAYATAEAFVQERAAWLERRLAHYAQLAAEVPRRALVSGELLPLLGYELQLVIQQERGRQRATVSEEAGVVTVRVSEPAAVRPALERWYRRQARWYFDEVTRELAAELKVRVRRIAIGDHSSQWGSCSSGGRLSFNWRLLLGPEAVARYVAAHEVAHLRHRGHTQRFWQTVERLHPGFEEQRRWLRRQAHRLVL